MLVIPSVRTFFWMAFLSNSPERQFFHSLSTNKSKDGLKRTTKVLFTFYKDLKDYLGLLIELWCSNDFLLSFINIKILQRDLLYEKKVFAFGSNDDNWLKKHWQKFLSKKTGLSSKADCWFGSTERASLLTGL